MAEIPKFEKVVETQLMEVDAGDKKTSQSMKQIADGAKEVGENVGVIGTNDDKTEEMLKKLEYQTWKLSVVDEDLKQRQEQVDRLLQQSDVVKGKLARMYEKD